MKAGLTHVLSFLALMSASARAERSHLVFHCGNGFTPSTVWIRLKTTRTSIQRFMQQITMMRIGRKVATDHISRRGRLW